VARPDLAAMVAGALPGSVVVMMALPDSVVHRQGNIAAVDIQAVRAQLATAQPFDRDYPGHIASHSRVAGPMAPAAARVVVVLRLPLSHSMC
jgi:hypothetical protein